MTQEELIDLIILLKCCSASLANKLATKLKLGNSCSFNNLILLNSYITILLAYNIEDTDSNCITTDDFDNIITKAKNICEFCDCE